MAIKTGQGSPISRRGEVLRSHRRPRISFYKIIAYMIGGIGDKLYILGSRIERGGRNTWRRIRKGCRVVFGWLGSIFVALFGAIGKALLGTWNDITLPFRKARKSYKSLLSVINSTRDRGKRYTRERIRLFFKYGWLWNKHLISRMFNQIVPIVALALCLIVVNSTLRLNYALKVSYNGQTLGYIENEGIYESARKIIENRIISGGEVIEWSNETELTVTVVQPSELSTQDVMAESLLSVSGSEIARATGIYVGGTLYGATTAPELLKDKLAELRVPYEQVALGLGDDTVVKFARDVELVESIYPVSSIFPIEELINIVASPDPMNIYYTAKIGESAVEIAMKNGITMAQLEEMNPDISLDFSQSGATLLVAMGEPLLRVKTVKQLTYTESVAYETITTRDNRLTVSDFTITQRGVAGERTIVKEMEYNAQGDVVLETIVSNVVTTPPIEQRLIIGTQGINVTGSAILLWPTGPGYTISRGWKAVGPSPHYGIDIAAPFGTAIYAAESGTVTLANYTGVGYGNYIIVTHAGQISTLYAHCSSLLVSEGQYVQRGELIALMGSTGNSTGNHLHFEVRLGGIRVPPEDWIY